MSKSVKKPCFQYRNRTRFVEMNEMGNCATRQNEFINAIIMFIFVNYSLFDKPTSNTSFQSNVSRIVAVFNSHTFQESGEIRGFKSRNLEPKKRIMPIEPMSLSMTFNHVQIRKQTMFPIRNPDIDITIYKIINQ